MNLEEAYAEALTVIGEQVVVIRLLQRRLEELSSALAARSDVASPFGEQSQEPHEPGQHDDG